MTVKAFSLKVLTGTTSGKMVFPLVGYYTTMQGWHTSITKLLLSATDSRHSISRSVPESEALWMLYSQEQSLLFPHLIPHKPCFFHVSTCSSRYFQTSIVYSVSSHTKSMSMESVLGSLKDLGQHVINSPQKFKLFTLHVRYLGNHHQQYGCKR